MAWVTAEANLNNNSQGSRIQKKKKDVKSVKFISFNQDTCQGKSHNGEEQQQHAVFGLEKQGAAHRPRRPPTHHFRLRKTRISNHIVIDSYERIFNIIHYIK